MDWSSSGRIDSFRYVRVDWDTWQETETLTGFTGGNLDRNDLTSIKASGELEYYLRPNLGKDLVRVYSDSYHPFTGEETTIAHGTYLVSTPTSTYKHQMVQGVADLYSVLQVLAEDAIDDVLEIPAGAVAVSRAAGIVSGAGLPVVASASGSTLNNPKTYDIGVSKLEIVNDLLDFAGFASANCDGYGNVILAPYEDPATKAPTVFMADDERCIFLPEVVHDYDIFNTANVVNVVVSNAEEGDITATAINDDPTSDLSTVSRGRRIVRTETISDIADEAAAQAKADALLAGEMSSVESLTIMHAYQPFSMGEVLDFKYRYSGLERVVAAVSQTMQLRPGMQCETRARRFIR